jgi:hypothetical protein
LLDGIQGNSKISRTEQSSSTRRTESDIMEVKREGKKVLSEEKAKVVKEAAELTPIFKKNSRRDAISLDLPPRFPSTSLFA